MDNAKMIELQDKINEMKAAVARVPEARSPEYVDGSVTGSVEQGPADVMDLDCDPVVRNAVVRSLKITDAKQLNRVCVCDVLDLRNIRFRRIYKLQVALEAHGLTLAPCRFVPQPILPGRKTPDHQHQVYLDGQWCRFYSGGWEPVPDQDVDLLSDADSLTFLKENFA